jgi:hypothetical protein
MSVPTAEEILNKHLVPANAMIEFAKLHVEAALKNASEKISDKKGKYIMPNKEFILISYSLDKIK